MPRRIVPVLVALTLAFGGPASFAGAAAPHAASFSHAADNGVGNGGNGDHGCGNGNGNGNAQNCAPEAPFPIGIPVAGLTVFGAYVWLARRRSAASQQTATIGGE